MKSPSADFYDRFRLGNLSAAETAEIVTLDYVLTWHFTDDYARDLQRYKELSEQRWNGTLTP
jgi:hypothetical protein